MNKIHTLLLLALCLFSSAAYAVIPNGSIAPDFTVTDVNGVTHNLYDNCEAGYTTIIDFSATWCPPCWSYHTSNALDDAYAAYGPNGTDQLRVIFLEGDTGTSLADLNGTGSNTQGDWIGTADFPIVNLPNNSIKWAYGVSAYPTIGAVCPSKKWYEIGPMTASQINSFMDQYCPVAFGANNISVTPYYGPELGCYDIEPFINITNLGSSTLNSATITLSLNGLVQETINWTGNLPTYEEQLVYFNPIVPNGVQAMEISVTNPNGSTDADMGDNSETVLVSLSNTTTQDNLTCTIVTDGYGYETYWELLDDAGSVLYSGGNANASPAGAAAAPGDANAYLNNSTYTVNMTLPGEGCYTFRIIDDYGDGICCNYGNGSYTIVDDMNNTILSGGQFGPIESRDFLRTSNNNVTVRAKVGLEGAMDGALMKTDLSAQGLLSTFQPFTTAPWNYGGAESLANFPNDAVDWVLVELRDGLNAGDMVAQKAGILLSNGEIVDAADTSDGLSFTGLGASSFYIVVRARGHLDVMSKAMVDVSNPTWYDFRTSASQAYGTGQLKNVSGSYVLYAGDADGDGVNEFDDFNLYLSDPSAISTLLAWDYDYDGHVTVADFNLYKMNASQLAVPEVRY